VKDFLDIDVPDAAICPDHSSPMDYLWHSFSADLGLPIADLQLQVDNRPSQNANRKCNADAIIWANRGGGKTELAAVATLLDCIFKPNCQVRILAGSGEQASRMYQYLVGFVCNGFEQFLAGPALKAKSRFANGSSVEVLTQSATSVRGQHIQKLRCDELELFNEEVFAAAKFTTHSTASITAAMELISTMHRPYGLMQKMVSSAPKSGTPIFKWCMWEVIEKCVDRSCSQCPLSSDCQGKAKTASGYLRIDDCTTHMSRARARTSYSMNSTRPYT
jgi:hypothetical protein